jgi:hypothetical protein
VIKDIKRPLFTLEDVLVIMKNCGLDTKCGACMAVAFVGSSFSEHVCNKNSLHSPKESL